VSTAGNPALLRRSGLLVERPGRVRALLALYGLAVGLLGAVHIEHRVPDHVQLMPTRARGIERSIAVLDRGGPPLLAANPAWAGASPPSGTTYFPVGSDDDPGLYLYVPLIADAVGTEASLLIVKWIFVVAFALLLVAYPLVFYELFGSVTAAIAAPLLALQSLSILYDTQFYWMPAWVTLALLPVVLLLGRLDWRPRAVAGMCALVLVAGVASSFRGGAGAGLLAAACILALLKLPTLRHKLAVVVLFGVCYLATNHGVVTAARAYRDHVVGKHVTEFHKTSWHNIYIGLSYIPNDHGITYSDSTALAAARRLDPEVDYLGPTYPETMRRVVWNLAKRDPGFILRNLQEKTGAIARAATDRYALVLLLVPAMMFLGSAASERRRWIALILPSLAIGSAPPVLVLPLEQYELGWLGAWALLWLLGVLWLVASAERAVLDIARRRDRTEMRRRAASLANQLGGEARQLWARFRRGDLLAWGVVVVLCAFLVATRFPTPAVVNPSYYESGQSTPLPGSFALGAAVRTWSLSAGVPDGWQVVQGTRATTRRTGLSVETTEAPTGYQLMSPVLTLPPGAYRAVVRGEISRGGLELGALDVERDRWIRTAHFSFKQKLDRALMHVEFSLERSERVQIILSNWAQENSTSAWTLQSAAIVRR
jgi:hypothetical protein